MNSQPKPIVVKGKTYLVHPLNFEEMGELQEWLYAQQRKQVMTAVEEAVERNKLPVEVQKYLALAALDTLARNRILIGTPEADTLMNSLEGIVYMTWLGVRRGDPSFRLEDAVEVAKVIVESAMGEAIQQQIIEAVDVLRTDDPKSTAGPANGSPTSGAPQRSEWTGGLSTPSSATKRSIRASRSAK